ncbi:hypothetical protein [Streptomyces sp. DSM 40907]|uniref:hypothetical protein n=1 Tax=Streptomyces kutzneri TaxID=3051179 RepID=UPI0028D5AD1B|nr:hypothetical protein [Streptomyces sp. DSM 40907]
MERDVGAGEDGVVKQPGELLARIRRRADGAVGGGGGDGLGIVGEVGQHQV